MKTLRQVCELTGVDRHVLQRIGTSKNNKKPLLPPSEIDSSSGYWYYDDDAIERLWLILLFRELDCTFKQIQEIMDAPGFNQREWFGKQITKLEKKKERFDKLIFLAGMIKTTGMLPTEYDNIKDYTIDEYLDHANDMIESVSDNVKETVSAVWNDKAFNAEISKVIAMKEQGAVPEDTKVQKAVDRMHKALKKVVGASARGVLSRTGQLLFADGDFADRFDEMKGNGSSTFVGEAIHRYCN